MKSIYFLLAIGCILTFGRDMTESKVVYAWIDSLLDVIIFIGMYLLAKNQHIFIFGYHRNPTYDYNFTSATRHKHAHYQDGEYYLVQYKKVCPKCGRYQNKRCSFTVKGTVDAMGIPPTYGYTLEEIKALFNTGKFNGKYL